MRRKTVERIGIVVATAVAATAGTLAVKRFSGQEGDTIPVGGATPAPAVGHCPDRGAANPNPADFQFCRPETTPSVAVAPSTIGATACGPLDGRLIEAVPLSNGTTSITNNGPCVRVYETMDSEQVDTIPTGESFIAGCYNLDNETIRIPIPGQNDYHQIDVEPGTIQFVGEGALAVPNCR